MCVCLAATFGAATTHKNASVCLFVCFSVPLQFGYAVAMCPLE